MGAIEDHHIYGLQVRESLDDGSDFTNPDADYRIVFLGEDGLLHAKDSSGTVTSLGGTGLTDPMTTRGDVIVRNASNVTARLAKGSADTFLGSDGTDVAYSAVTDAKLSTSDITTNNVSTTKHGFAPKAPNDATKYLDGTGAYSVPAGSGGGGLVLLEQHTASSSATLDFTTGITSTYDEYLIEGVGIVAASNAVNLLMTFSSDGGSSWLSGSTYEWNYLYLRGNASGLLFANPDTAVHIANAVSNASNADSSFTIRLYNPLASAYTRVLFDILQPNSGDSGNVYRYVGDGSYKATTALNAVRFAFSSGNIASGVIRLYGLAK